MNKEDLDIYEALYKFLKQNTKLNGYKENFETIAGASYKYIYLGNLSNKSVYVSSKQYILVQSGNYSNKLVKCPNKCLITIALVTIATRLSVSPADDKYYIVVQM